MQFPRREEIRAVNHMPKWKKIGLNAVLFSYACGQYAETRSLRRKIRYVYFSFTLFYFLMASESDIKSPN